MGTTLAILQSSGTVAVFNDKLHIFVSSSLVLVFGSVRTLGWIPSGPADWLQFNFSACSVTFSDTLISDSVSLSTPKKNKAYVVFIFFVKEHQEGAIYLSFSSFFLHFWLSTAAERKEKGIDSKYLFVCLFVYKHFTKNKLKMCQVFVRGW